jgi:serine/threonine-protein kinase
MSNTKNASGHPSSIYDYDVIDLIGEGAGSVIYAVSHRLSKQIYALKHVMRKTDKDIRFIDQLENEFNVGTKVKHKGVRRVVDVKTNRSMLRKATEAALVMELFDGVPLDQQQRPSIRKLVGCFVDTARALQAVHQAGFVHCDLKPNNILFSAECETKVIDLGQACPIGTKKERIQGTPDYIAPEQVRLEPVTQRTDVFNFGATMYWCLTGRKMPTLFTLKKSENSFLCDDAIPTPNSFDARIPLPLSNLIMDCVQTKASKRPGDMGEISSRLQVMEHALNLAQLEDSAVGAA